MSDKILGPNLRYLLRPIPITATLEEILSVLKNACSCCCVNNTHVHWTTFKRLQHVISLFFILFFFYFLTWGGAFILFFFAKLPDFLCKLGWVLCCFSSQTWQYIRDTTTIFWSRSFSQMSPFVIFWRERLVVLKVCIVKCGRNLLLSSHI